MNLVSFESKRGMVVGLKEVKSKQITEFKPALKKVFKFFRKTMSEHCLVSGEPDGLAFLDFCCLAFSEKRVLEIANEMERKEYC